MLKTCSKCKIEKDISYFGTDNTRPDKHCYWCRECQNIRSKQTFQGNRDYWVEWMREHYKKTKSEHNARTHKWYVENADQHKEYITTRRHEIRTEEPFPYTAWKRKVKRLGCKCYYCSLPLTFKRNRINTITVDHNIPIKRGGTNVIRNLLPACKKCNKRKYTKTAKEFLKEIKKCE